MTFPPPRIGPRGVVRFTPGLGATTDLTKSGQAGTNLGATVIRMPWDISTASSAMRSNISFYAARGITPLLVALFNGRTPTVAEAQNVGTWAAEFGPGGTYWGLNQTLSPRYAVRHIEFGHETSYGYQYADAYNSPTYIQRAKDYASRFQTAYGAIAATGVAVGLLAQGEDGGSASPNWVNGMFDQVPGFGQYVAGWTIHPYGPRARWEPKIDRLIDQTADRGGSGGIPIDITAYGIASDDGVTLDDNFGWPLNETYVDAASALSAMVVEMRTKSGLAERLRYFIINSAHDLTAPGANIGRDNYLGGVQFDVALDKGDYSDAIRSIFIPNFVAPPPPPPPPPDVTICRNGVTMQVPPDQVLPTDTLGACPPPPPPPPVDSKTPVVVPSVGTTPANLRLGSATGARLQWKGVNVWGLVDNTTNDVTVGGLPFHQNQYNNRAAIAATIKAWGANCVRFRMLADDYNNAPNANTDNLNRAQMIQRVKDWRDVIVGQNMYFIPCTWDALDGAFSDAAWAGNGQRVHQMFTDVKAALGNDPMVVYEVTNEPNTLGSNGHDTAAWDAWETNMKLSISHFRDVMNYKGVLIIDPIWWANSGPSGFGYDDNRYTNLELWDAGRAGMGGKHQLIFAKHDYANNYASLAWSPSGWQTGQGGTQIKHLIFENEFGNYNGAPNTVSDTWSSQASSFFANRFSSEQNYVGGCGFLFGPWSDANAMTVADNTNTTTWGNTVRQNFLLNAPTPPPPTSGFSPGVDGGSVAGLSGSLDASANLGAKVVRQEFTLTAAANTLDSVVAGHAARGMRVLLLAGLPNLQPPTAAQAQNLANWANRFGPGGAFWVGRSDGHLAVRHIEYGNETAFNYQAGGPNTAASYAQKAKDYATTFKVARDAIAATGKAVGLICQGHAPDSLSPQWVDNMYIAVPNLYQYVAGWVTHPYGPDYMNKLNDLISRQAAKGAPNTIPIDITEIGIATDNGPLMEPDNYNWPRGMTYQEVADTWLPANGTLTGNTIVANLRNSPTIGPRLRHFMIFQNKDQQPSGTRQREHYFGLLKNTGADKGAISARGRMIMAMSGSAATVVRTDNCTLADPTSLWGTIEAVSAARHQRLTEGSINFRRLTVVDGDDFSGERAEIGRNERRNGLASSTSNAGTFYLYNNGVRAITEFDMRLPTGFPLSTGNFQVVMQMKQTQPYGALGGNHNSPILSMEARNGALLACQYGVPFWTGPAPALNTWIPITWDVTYNPSASIGQAQITIGSTTSPVFTLATIQTAETASTGLNVGDAIPSHLRLGIYHDPGIAGTSADYSDIKISVVG